MIRWDICGYGGFIVIWRQTIMILTIFGLGLSGCVYANTGYHYEKQEINQHVLHIVTLHPKDYKIEIVKANDAAMGRETVLSMANRLNADIAVNGGFFEIGDKRDGKPSGTLVVKGHKYNVVNKVQPLVVITPDRLLIEESNPKKYLGNLNNVSIVSGIPLLLSNNKVVQALTEKTSDFYTSPHARTALGVKADGTIVIVVAEHKYLRDLTKISMGEVQSLMKEKGEAFAQQYHHQNSGDITLNELKEILRKEHASQEGPQGITILELAELMEKLGCQSALNLDGGGSSTLCINKKLVNRSIGDTDEGNGVETMRPVSDAIIFRRK